MNTAGGNDWTTAGTIDTAGSVPDTSAAAMSLGPADTDLYWTAWWSLTFASDTVIQIDAYNTVSDGSNVHMYVYTGSSYAGRTYVTDDWGSFWFLAQAGVTYHLAAGAGDSAATGVTTYRLVASLMPGQPPNDDLANRIPLSLGVSYECALADATLEGGESVFTGTYYKSVWYEFTPTHNMLLGMTGLGTTPSSAVRWWLCTGTNYGDLVVVQSGLDAFSGSGAVALTGGTTYLIRFAVPSTAPWRLSFYAEEYVWTDWVQPADDLIGITSPIATLPDLEFLTTGNTSTMSEPSGTDLLADSNTLLANAVTLADSVNNGASDAFITSGTGIFVNNTTHNATHDWQVYPVYSLGSPNDSVFVTYNHTGYGVYAAPSSVPTGTYTDGPGYEYESSSATLISVSITIEVQYEVIYNAAYTNNVSGHVVVGAYLPSANNNNTVGATRVDVFSADLPYVPFGVGGGAGDDFVTINLNPALYPSLTGPDGIIFYPRFTTHTAPHWTNWIHSAGTAGDQSVEYRTDVFITSGTWTWRPPRYRNQVPGSALLTGWGLQGYGTPGSWHVGSREVLDKAVA